MRHWVWLVVALVLLLAAMMEKDRLVGLPPVAAAAPGEFDAARAAERLARILGPERPHPVDSDEGDRVRERLIAEMRAVGLAPRVDDGMACNGSPKSRGMSCARVRNLVATIGPENGQPLLLFVSHYDSTPAGPGAADDGIGVATMLEIAHLLSDRPLKGPIGFLFNEGEERGLVGARAFLDRDPLAERVGTLVNLEARGVTGPAIMFETNRPNGPAIALYRKVGRPVANSLTTDLYRMIPNSTDVAVFSERDWTILNFAVIGDESRYHSMDDNLASLDRRSLQHMGDQALVLAQRAASGDLPGATGERLYGDFASRFLVALPLAFGILLLVILLAFLAIEARRRRALGLPLLAMFAAIGDALILAWLAIFLVGLARRGDFWRAFPQVTFLAIFVSALACIIFSLVLLVRDVPRARLRAAWWLFFLVLGALVGMFAPGGMIFFLLPPLVAGIGMALEPRLRGAETIGAWLAAILLFLTFGPALGLMEELLNDGPLWVFAPLSAIVMLPFLVELSPLLAAVRGRLLLGGVALLLLAAWTAVLLVPAYSTDRPQLFTIEYLWDASEGEGRFATHNDGKRVPFDGEWERLELPHTARMRWATPAPPHPVEPPAAALVGERPAGNGRHLRLRLRAAEWESVTLSAPADASLVAAGPAGALRRFGEGAAEQKYAVRCVGRSCDGWEVDLVTSRAGPVELQLVGTRPGLPPVAEPLARMRPATARPQYGPDSTIALRRVRF